MDVPAEAIETNADTSMNGGDIANVPISLSKHLSILSIIYMPE
jgi:hypothetical protein